MINGFIFNQDVVLQMLLIVIGVICGFVAAGLLTFFLIELVERNCRHDLRYDNDGRKDG